MTFESGHDDTRPHRPAAAFRPPAPLKVLVASHSHPRLTSGGAELSAAALVRGLQTHAGAKAWLLGCSRKPQAGRLGVALTQPFGVDDFVYQVPDSFDTFKFANRDREFPRAFRELLLDLSPDVVHFHHYSQFGVEAFAIVKQALPQAQVVLTLHEYLAICNNNGQMVKRTSQRLCASESLLDCSDCFPTLSPQDFFLRKAYIRRFFEKVDLFVAPSHFLAERYRNWGLPKLRCVVIPNVPTMLAPGAGIHSAPAAPAVPPRHPPMVSGLPTPRIIRFGYFGQMFPLKGIQVLLDAAAELDRARIDTIAIDIYGDSSSQAPEFQLSVEAGLQSATGNVSYHGPYDNAQVYSLMQSVDVIVVPSLWWENSPVVIEEALAARRPVLCSNIGGMAEKIRPGSDGWWFEAGNSRDLARVMWQIAQTPSVIAAMAGTARQPVTVENSVLAHLAAYHTLLNLADAGSALRQE